MYNASILLSDKPRNLSLQLLLELCDKTVKDEVKARKNELPTREEVAGMLRPVVSGLAFMHDEKNMAHRDIDTRNVLRRPDGTYCIGMLRAYKCSCRPS